MGNAKNQRTGREVKMLCEQMRQTTESGDAQELQRISQNENQSE